MSKFAFGFSLLLALTACSSRVTPADMDLAAQQCSSHGGAQGVQGYEDGKTIVVVCGNGLLIEIKKHNVRGAKP